MCKYSAKLISHFLASISSCNMHSVRDLFKLLSLASSPNKLYFLVKYSIYFCSNFSAAVLFLFDS